MIAIAIEKTISGLYLLGEETDLVLLAVLVKVLKALGVCEHATFAEASRTGTAVDVHPLNGLLLDLRIHRV
jgi:hypothetical protein